jgi:hypothetical protein
MDAKWLFFAILGMKNIQLEITQIFVRTVYKHYVRFQVLTAASMKMVVFWVVAPCSLVNLYRRFRGSCCLHHQGDRPDDLGNKHV